MITTGDSGTGSALMASAGIQLGEEQPTSPTLLTDFGNSMTCPAATQVREESNRN